MKQAKLISLIGLGFTLFFSKPHLIYGSSGYGGGSGTQSDPYLISTPDHLNQLQLDVNVNGVDTAGKYYRLTNNIDLSGYDNDSDPTNGNFTPIGSDSSATFKGTFDGNNKVISNLKIILPEQDYVGLFGYTDNGKVQNIGLENVVVEGNYHTGGLIGYQSKSLINKNYVMGEVSGNVFVGGLVGHQDDSFSTISQSYATGNVNGSDDVGGLVGYQNGGTIDKSYTISVVSGTDRMSSVGGLVGYQYDGAINQSYTMGSVSGLGNVGGLVGQIYDGIVNQSYATSDVSEGWYIGGLVGKIYNGIVSQSYATGKLSEDSNTIGGLIGYRERSSSFQVENSYWDIETTGQSSSTSGTGLTTTQMTGEAAKTNMTGFDFEMVWNTTNKYPQLQWQSEETVESTDTVKDVTVNGTVQTMIADVVIPATSPDLVINPNLPEGFVAPEFSVSNDSVSPIKLELKTFEQTTNTFNDVLPSKYSSWEGLNKQQSQDIALGLVAKEGDGWQVLTTPTSYVANHTDHEIGIIKPTSSVDFSFDVKHGTSFSEAHTVQYKMVFMFDLMS